MKAPNEELINNLTIKAGVMEMGEKIAWGSDTALMRQAAATLQSQAERIAELERESETHSKAYGLAIVERDNLRHELKTAQEGWRCECSTDDACRFARERDALRAQLAAIAATEPVFYEFQWTNPGNQTDQPESMFVWARVEPRWNSTVQQKVDELLAYRYEDKPTYRVRALFTRPMPAQIIGLQDVHDAVTADPTLAESNAEFDESQFKSVEDLIAHLNKLNSYRDRTLEALSKYKGAK